MPEINKITEVLHDGNQPYHVHFDNLPLKNILTRIDLVNAQVDINSDILRGACGTAGSLNNRLDVSMNDNGSLKYEAVNASLHNIGAHQDGSYEGIDYVRMTAAERDKLSLIQSEANKLYIEIEDMIPISATISSISTTPEYVTLTNGTLKLKGSDTVIFDFQAPDTLRVHSAFPSHAAHRHNYGIFPAHSNPSGPNYLNFITTSTNTPYVEGSLRVYVNGMRIYSPGEFTPAPSINVPNYDASDWVELYVSSENPNTGEFSLNIAISAEDKIIIDFDQALTPPPAPL